MQLYFIRHAQSENNQLFVRTGSMDGRSPDPELTPTGQEQAQVLAEFLSQDRPSPSARLSRHDPQNIHGFDFTHLYCSLMVRSVATGTAVARALGLSLIGWEDLHESGGIYRFGRDTDERIGLPGPNRAYFEQHYPDLVLAESLGEAGWWNRPYELREARPLRARRVLRMLRHRHGGSSDRVAVISHGGFYNHLLRAILNLPEDQHLWFSLSNTGITRIDFEDDEAWVAYMNRLEFMPRELVT
jgi:2,3-bisphosphoglycerate-dependent phosphoglycerate mutase